MAPSARPGVRSRARGAAAVLLLVVATGGVSGCGAQTVDPGREADVLVATCRSWLERIAAKADVDPDEVEVDPEAFEEVLRSEPGGTESSVAGTVKRRCMEALRDAKGDTGS